MSGLRLVALLGTFYAGAALAQGTSVLTGTVTDASTHNPVVDVVVTGEGADGHVVPPVADIGEVP